MMLNSEKSRIALEPQKVQRGGKGFGGAVYGWGEAAVFLENFVDTFDSLNAVQYNLDL